MLFLSLFSSAVSKIVYPKYSPVGGRLCENYKLQYFDKDANPQTYDFVVTDANSSTYDTYNYVVEQCNTFFWGMGTTNDNPKVFGKGDALRIWLDDATTYSTAPTGHHSSASKQLTNVANAQGWTPQITIRDKKNDLFLDRPSVVFNESESVWDVGYENVNALWINVSFDDIPNFFLHASENPISGTYVYPPVPNGFKIGNAIVQQSAGKIIMNSYRAPLTAKVAEGVLYVSPSYFDGYYKSSIVDEQVVDAGFIDSSIVVKTVDNKLLVYDYETDQTSIFEGVKGTTVVVPSYCDFMRSGYGIINSDIICFTKDETSFDVISRDGDSKVSNVPCNGKVKCVTGTTGRNGVFFVLVELEGSPCVCRYDSRSSEFTDPMKIDVSSSSDDVIMHWSAFGFLVVAYGNRVWATSDGWLRFVEVMEFNKGVLPEFVAINEDNIGNFLLTGKDGSIYYFSMDIPYLMELETSVGDSTVAVSAVGFVLVGASQTMNIPLESERAVLRTSHSLECPISSMHIAGLEHERIFLDKRDVFTYNGSIVSNGRHSFRMKLSPSLISEANISTSTRVQIHAHESEVDTVVVMDIAGKLFPTEEGSSKFMIHSTAENLACLSNTKAIDIIVGCSGRRHLKVRHGSETVSYSAPYYTPIIDVYDDVTFVEQYTGPIYVSTTKKFLFTDGNEDCLYFGGKNTIQLTDSSAPYDFLFTISPDWSYCDLNVSTTVRMIVPKELYRYHIATGVGCWIGLHVLLVIIYICKMNHTRNTPFDRLPLSIGIAVEDEKHEEERLIHVLIERNTKFEKSTISVTQCFKVKAQNKREYHATLYRGERPTTRGNKFLSTMMIKLPEAEARGNGDIKVECSVDRYLNITWSVRTPGKSDPVSVKVRMFRIYEQRKVVMAIKNMSREYVKDISNAKIIKTATLTRRENEKRNSSENSAVTFT